MTEREVVQVKFFDHKKGFGFIDVLKPDSDYYGQEVFFHFSEINCKSQFKKVIPGEIVSFVVSNKEGDDKKKVCTDITGVYNAVMLVDNDSFVYKVNKKRPFRPDDDEPAAEADEER